MNEMDFLRSDMQKLVNENGKLRTRVADLECRNRKYEEDEASVCPEDVGFVEFIQQQQQRVADLEANERELRNEKIQAVNLVMQQQQQIQKLERERQEQIDVLMGANPLSCRNGAKHPIDPNHGCLYCIIQQQQQTIELSERYRKDLIGFFDIKGNPHWGDVAVLIGAKVREMKQTIERLEAALKQYADKENWHRVWVNDESTEVSYWELEPDGWETAIEALTHKPGGE